MSKPLNPAFVLLALSAADVPTTDACQGADDLTIGDVRQKDRRADHRADRRADRG